LKNLNLFPLHQGGDDMNRCTKGRVRCGGLFALALGVLALLALPGLAAAKHRHHGHVHHHRGHGHGVVTGGAGGAGTIQSYDPATGKLTIALTGGETITGTVTEQTRIQCGCQHGDEQAGEEDASDSRDGNAPGQGPEGPGPQHQGPPPQGEGGEGEGPSQQGPPPQGGKPGKGQGDQQGNDCSTADLVVGAEVKEAQIDLHGGSASFELIALGHGEGGGS
jgi:hypothetical protein